MAVAGSDTTVILGDLIRQCLREGLPVNIDGLVTFKVDQNGKVAFTPFLRPRVFLAYVDEDFNRVKQLYDALASAGFDPWLDKCKLMPGQDWTRCIERTITVADFFVPCFSQRALRKRGQFQRELRLALATAAQMPLDDVFIMPVRLEPCEVPRRLRDEYQYVDLFPDWDAGVHRLIRSIQDNSKSRQKY